MESIVAGWTESQGGQIVDFLQKLIINVMKYLHGEKIINHMGMTKLKIFNRHWKKFKWIIIDPKRRFLRFPGSYKRPIRMRRNIGIRKA